MMIFPMLSPNWSLCFGVKEEMPFHDLVTLLRKKDTEGCVQEIATGLGLPIRISCRMSRKTSGQVLATDSEPEHWHGQTGLATVLRASLPRCPIPQHLPMFGSSGLQGFPIRVRVSENCHAHPDTFVAIMAHELSHVLLASLWSPHKDSELHTDLVPIVLGFR